MIQINEENKKNSSFKIFVKLGKQSFQTMFLNQKYLNNKKIPVIPPIFY